MTPTAEGSRPIPGPATTFAGGLQHERTALAWERTAIAMMVAGLVLARAATLGDRWVLAGVGVIQTAGGAVLLVWAGAHYVELHGPLRRGDDVVHPRAARWVGAVAVVGSGAGLLLALLGALNT